MKLLIVLALLLGYVGSAEAWWWHHKPEPVVGTQGPKGDPGDSIVGPAGVDGRDGRDGRDIRNGATTVNLGVNVRWLDFKHADLSSGYRRDVKHGGNTIDALILGIKVGKSYEQKRIEALEKKLERALVIHPFPVETEAGQ